MNHKRATFVIGKKRQGERERERERERENLPTTLVSSFERRSNDGKEQRAISNYTRMVMRIMQWL